jgi:acyl-CoA synthetase (AMP-forming)/AMP-acid ligase II
MNPNLQGSSLVHVLKVSGASKVIMQASPAAQKQLLEAVLELSSAKDEWEIYHFEDKIDMDDKFAKLSLSHIDMESLSSSAPDSALKDTAEFSSPAMLIYTSGTTGLPKAAYISHSRFILAMCAFSGYIRIKQSDRLYSCLPLYHASAAMAGFGAVARSGATLILVPKFSARNFFPECKKYHATMIHYIGELARFLMSVPVNPAVDTDHYVKTAFGNGMRPDIWLAFKKRFGIKAVAEFYASTEGTAALANYQNNDDFGVGAMGRQGLLQSVSVPLALIRFDQVQEEPIRDAQGRCIRVCLSFP